ncbi:SLC13 family permease [Luteococcus peritonei]|uniref:SLC13 family permease n=1 Tax=Luteococcus peritonei TaxID=88874 RepID=A0ABW4RSR9_9ACTN
MPLTEIIPLLVLIGMFIVATKWPLNIGVMGFVASFFVGYFVLGMDDKEIFKEFPVSIVMTIIGVTYFFSMAQNNGTIDLIVRKCISAVRGKVSVMPWIFFVLASILTALGTFSPAAVALLAPAGMAFAHRSRFSPIAVGALIINGAHAGGFSPISVSGVLVHGIATKNGYNISSTKLFLASYAINLILSILTVVVLAAMRKLHETGPVEAADDDVLVDDGKGVTSMQWLTLALIGAIIVAAIGFKLPISLVSLTAGLVMAFFNIKEHKSFINGISWSTVLLVGGMVTYVSLLTHAGVIDTLANGAVKLGSPLLVALVLCYVIGVASAFASSTALLTAFIPLAVPLLASSNLSPIAVMAALSISATIVDVSPFSTDGALIVANARGEHSKTIYNRLMGYAGIVVITGPLLAWGLLVALRTI